MSSLQHKSRTSPVFPGPPIPMSSIPFVWQILMRRHAKTLNSVSGIIGLLEMFQAIMSRPGKFCRRMLVPGHQKVPVYIVMCSWFINKMENWRLMRSDCLITRETVVVASKLASLRKSTSWSWSLAIFIKPSGMIMYQNSMSSWAVKRFFHEGLRCCIAFLLKWSWFCLHLKIRHEWINFENLMTCF